MPRGRHPAQGLRLLLMMMRGCLAPQLLLLLLLRPPSTPSTRTGSGPSGPSAVDIVLILDRDALGHVVDLVDADEAGGELEHVVAEGDDDELGVFGAFFDVVRDDGDLCVRG